VRVVAWSADMLCLRSQDRKYCPPLPTIFAHLNTTHNAFKGRAHEYTYTVRITSTGMCRCAVIVANLQCT